MGSGKGKEEGVMILPLSSDMIKKVSRALSNETTLTVLKKLVEKSMSATELSESLVLPLTTVKYSIDALLDAELIEVNHVRFSRKRRDIKYYAPVKKALILVPEKTEKEVIKFLKKVLPAIVILALSIPAGLTLQYIIAALSGPPHELPFNHANIPFYVFIAGVIFAIMMVIILEKLIAAVRKKKETPRLISSKSHLTTSE